MQNLIFSNNVNYTRLTDALMCSSHHAETGKGGLLTLYSSSAGWLVNFPSGTNTFYLNL